MSVFNSPVVKKFFTNKIESSRPEWGDYLLEIADIFSTFDGEELDRESLTDRFSVISGRSPYALRDVSNFRDEFGAYGTYLGLFYVKQVEDKHIIYLSKAAKYFLCSTEPNVEAFCRSQLALFQYPNGAGAVPEKHAVQNNVITDTMREIEHGIRLNPFRLLCRTVVAMHELMGVPLSDLEIPYKTIFQLFNDTLVNQTYTPLQVDIVKALETYSSGNVGWAQNDHDLRKFKRNFHIFLRTGIFSRTPSGLTLVKNVPEKAYNYAKVVANMTEYFPGFENCYGNLDVKSKIRNVILSPQWGEYYDAFNIPLKKLQFLADAVEYQDVVSATHTIGAFDLQDAQFPPLQEFRNEQIRAFVLSESGSMTNILETMVRREKANREHARILTMLSAKLRVNGFSVYENVYIDLYAEKGETRCIFEVKSNNEHNTLSQIRKAIAQLYEYRYRSKKPNTPLCIVLQQRPPQKWVEEYLLLDRHIMVCWLVDSLSLECPQACKDFLSTMGIIGS